MLPSLVNSRQRGEENRKDCSREGPHICKAGRHPRTRTSSCGGANHMIIHMHVDTIYLSLHTYMTYMCRTSKELGTAFTNMHNRSSSCGSSSNNNNNNHNRRCSWGQRKDRSSTPRSSSYHHDDIITTSLIIGAPVINSYMNLLATGKALQAGSDTWHGV